MSTKVVIRMASETDAQEILKIYSTYITDTAITFEYEVPSIIEFTKRIQNIIKKYPYVVAVEENHIIGYAYASAFKERAAYDWAVETSIYLIKDCRGRGVGKMLYFALEDILKRQNILNVYACIAYTPVIDIHLDNTSIEFHQYLGYSKAGHFTKCGYKFDTWYDMIWMEKMIGDRVITPELFIPITEIEI